MIIVDQIRHDKGTEVIYSQLRSSASKQCIYEVVLQQVLQVHESLEHPHTSARITAN